MKNAIRVIALALTVAVSLMGCAGAAKGPSDEELIKATLGKWQEALVAKNIDNIVACYSDEFKDGDGRGKPELKGFISEAISAGYLDGIKVSMEGTTTKIDGDKATVTPIGLSGNAGGMSLTLTLGKANGQWLITSSSEG